MDKMREEFEIAWKSARIGKRYSSEHIQVELDSFYPELNKYGYSAIQEAWFFWQASRKALVVELPFGEHDTFEQDVDALKRRLSDAGVSYK